MAESTAIHALRMYSAETAVTSSVRGSVIHPAMSTFSWLATSVCTPVVQSTRSMTALSWPTELRRNQASPARLTCKGSVLRTSSASIDMISSKAVPFHFKIADPRPLVSHGRCEPGVQPAVKDKARDFIRILIDEPALASSDVDYVEVVPSCVAVVHADGNEMRVLAVHAEDNREHVAIRRQIPRIRAVDSDAPEVEILVAVLVLVEQHVRIGTRDPVREDRSVGLAGQWAGFGQIVARRYPDVHDAVDGGDPGEPAPIGREQRIEGIGILEERLARNEWNAGIANHTHLAEKYPIFP